MMSLSCTNKAPNPADSGVLMIAEQGSFAVGGTVVTTPGVFDNNAFNGFSPANGGAGQTLHADHAYVSYQIPPNAQKNSLVFLHGAASSSAVWETTPDGRDGFNNLFLRQGFGVYLVDQPRRGRAGRSTVGTTITPATDEQMWYDI